MNLLNGLLAMGFDKLLHIPFYSGGMKDYPVNKALLFAAADSPEETNIPARLTCF